MSTLENINPQILQKIQSLRLMDDDFMTVVFAEDSRATEFLLRIILHRDDLKVIRSMTQKEKRNLFGRSVKLDILAEDENKKLYNIEIQRSDKGADARRVRYNIAMLDSHTLKKNDDYSKLPELYIIFITENDYLGLGKPIYEVSKQFIVKEKYNHLYLPFEDGCNIMYVNGAYRGNDAIGKLMHDFSIANADEMFYEEIAKRVRFHKQEEQGVRTMCRIIEEYGEEKKAEGKLEGKLEGILEGKLKSQKETAKKLLEDGRYTIKEIAKLLNIPEKEIS